MFGIERPAKRMPILLQGEEDQHVHLEEDEEEPEVLDLESPAFDIRSPEELPAQPSQTDIVDKMEFEAEDTSTSATGTLSQRSSCALHSPSVPAAINAYLQEINLTPSGLALPWYFLLTCSQSSSCSQFNKSAAPQ